nr:MAG TPA: Protein of unknown function (DUF1642) [Caudoviricetes sp.]
MNIKALIKKYEAVECVVDIVSGKTILKSVLRDLQQLDKPQPVKVPPFVAVWYEINKENFDKNIAYLCLNNWGEFINDKTLFNWMSNTDNFIQILVNMHQFGYEVEEEKRYLVKMKGIVNALSFLIYHKNADIWTVTDKNNSDGHRAHHTRKELEGADFGWVFDCPGIEIEDVE